MNTIVAIVLIVYVFMAVGFGVGASMQYEKMQVVPVRLGVKIVTAALCAATFPFFVGVWIAGKVI